METRHTERSCSMAVRHLPTCWAVTVMLLTGGCAGHPQTAKVAAMKRGDEYVQHQKYVKAILEYQNALKTDSK